MERPPAFANLRIILQIFGFLIALEGFAEYFADRHYTDLLHPRIRARPRTTPPPRIMGRLVQLLN
jgi:hypothetical protein